MIDWFIDSLIFLYIAFLYFEKQQEETGLVSLSQCRAKVKGEVGSQYVKNLKNDNQV